MPPNHAGIKKSHLATLASRGSHAILQDLTAVSLASGQILAAPLARVSRGYFITSGMACCITTMRNGETSASHVIGPEGFVGFVGGARLPNVTIEMLVAGSALWIAAGALLEELKKPGLLQSIMQRYAHARMAEITQAAACNALHCIEERLACWLLLIADRVGAEFKVTHQAIAQMLGSRRATVTLEEKSFQRIGLIEYHYGRLHILDRKRLEKLACECYEIRTHTLDDVFVI